MSFEVGPDAKHALNRCGRFGVESRLDAEAHTKEVFDRQGLPLRVRDARHVPWL
jgi:hypothetical protein